LACRWKARTRRITTATSSWLVVRVGGWAGPLGSALSLCIGMSGLAISKALRRRRKCHADGAMKGFRPQSSYSAAAHGTRMRRRAAPTVPCQPRDPSQSIRFRVVGGSRPARRSDSTMGPESAVCKPADCPRDGPAREMSSRCLTRAGPAAASARRYRTSSVFSQRNLGPQPAMPLAAPRD